MIGGGIAGLVAAYALKDRDVVLFESTSRLGGRIMSEKRGSYWLNFGAHLMPGPDTRTGRIMTELGLSTATLPGTITGISLNGKVVSTGPIETYPLRLPMSLIARMSFIRAGLKMRRAVAAYLRDAPRRPDETVEQTRARRLAFMGDLSFAEFMGKMHPDVEAIFRATTARVTASMDEVAAGCGVAHFVAAMSGSHGKHMRNLPGGSALFTQALASALGDRFFTDATVSKVAADRDDLVVSVSRMGRQESVRTRCVVAAVPAFAARRILTELPADTCKALEAIPYGPFVVGAMITGESKAMPWDHVYSVTVARKSFNMFFNMANVLRTDASKRQAGGSLMVYAGGELGETLLDRTDDQITDTFLADLHDVYPMSKGLVREMVVQRWPRAIPYVRPGRYKLQQALERDLGNLFLAGDYFDNPGVDGAVSTALRAAEGARRRLANSS